jgi:lipopolysaccharide/colanic/teichoic acid biosynthesis glycosyltransferase
MVQHAETKTGPVLSVRNDPRVTPVGRFLRKSRLDELPQLWNILCGDMSLVGPRPERPMFVEQFEREMPGYHLRHAVRSGLTGLAQVYGNYATSAGDKLIFDLIYIRDWSLLMDLQIVLRTVTAVFRREASEGIALPEEEVRL